MSKIWMLLTVIRINPFFWIVLAIGLVTGYFREVLMLFSIVLIHELGHATAAVYFGWKVKKIELLPFGGVAEIEDSGNKPIKEELWVVMAGPAQHLWMMGASYVLVATPFWSATSHQLFIWHNVIILCFNLLPILPLDGGRFVQLWFMERWAYRRAHRASLYSSFIGLGLLAIAAAFLPFHLNLYIVLTFLLINNYLEWKQRHYRFMRFLASREHTKMENRQSVTIHVDATMPIREAVALLRRDYDHCFILKHPNRTLHEKEVLDGLFKHGTTLSLLQLFEPPPRMNSPHIKVQ